MTTLHLPSFHLSFFKNQEDDLIYQKTNVANFLEFVKANPDENFELVNGKIIPMSNASPKHGKIITNFSRIIPNYLVDNNSPCFYFSDMACKIDEFTCPQPDILVVCNASVDSNLLKYPTLVGEVHSPSNRQNDFDKLARYKECSSIQEILMIEQDTIKITVYQRNGLNWSEITYSKGDMLNLNSINLAISIDEIYRQVNVQEK